MIRTGSLSGHARAMTEAFAQRWLRPDILRIAAWFWIPSACVALAYHLFQVSGLGPATAEAYAFGDDFINFWSAPRLALLGRVADVYRFAPFHQFELGVLGEPIHLYHYSYPPVMILLTLPFAVLPYGWGLAAWLVGGVAMFGWTVSAAWPRAMRRRGDAALYALAVPAVYVNALAGQNGTWVAALIGGGLMAIARRPVLGGALLGLLVAKPQMAMLVPVALLCGRRWSALAACGATAVLTMAVTVGLFGVDPWWAFADRLALLRRFILEDGGGYWHLFVSVFVTVRHLPAPVSLAYAVQAVAAVAALVLVIAAWRSSAPQNAKNAVLVMAAFFATPYVQVYDAVVTALVPIWLMTSFPEGDARRRAALFAAVPLLSAPSVTPFVAKLTGLGFGCLLLLPALVVAAQACRGGATLTLPSPAVRERVFSASRVRTSCPSPAPREREGPVA